MKETKKPSTTPTALDHFNSAAHIYERLSGACTREVAKMLCGLPQFDSISSSSVILDNACGTGIVTEEIIQRFVDSGATLPQILAVDGAPKMVEILCSKLASERFRDYSHKIQCDVMDGERLGFEDQTFTHSITNMGLFFFSDPAAGAKEIFRTLKSGGFAFVTSWLDLGYLDAVIRPTQRKIRPQDPVYKLPIPEEWLQLSHLEDCLRQYGGFTDVELMECTAHFGAATIAELSDLLYDSFSVVWKTYSEAEKAGARNTVLEYTQRSSVPYTSPFGNTYVGIPMKAAIAVARGPLV